MADDLSTRLEPFASPDASLPAIFTMPSPSQSPLRKPDGSPRLRTVPSDPTLSFSFARPRVQNGQRELRLAVVRAEEDEARIAALEEQLAEARDSEDAQRKSAARLRRDVSQLRRQLQHAEDAAAATQEVSFAERERSLADPESVDSWRHAAASSVRPRGSYGPPSDDEDRLGWGATAFPEYVREEAGNLADCEVASESTTRPVDHSAGSDKGHETVLGDIATLCNDNTPPPEVATIVIPAKSRPQISASTFLTPARVEEGKPLTPRLTVEGVSCPGSPTAPTLKKQTSQASIQSRKSISSTRSYSSLSRASFSRLRALIQANAAADNASHTSAESLDPHPVNEITPSPLSGMGSRMDSIRSLLSDYVGPCGRSLGSELGSNFRSSPVKPFTPSSQLDDKQFISPLPSEVSAALDTLARAFAQQTPELKTPSRLYKRSASTVSFRLGGALAVKERANAYDSVLDAPRHIRFSDRWSPETKPTPTPSPRAVPNASYDWSSSSEVSDDLCVPTLSTLQMPGAGPSLSPSPRVTTHLAPRNDPWDEYSDRPTPSPRLRHLRPLLLCSRPAIHARKCSLAIARDRSARGMAYTGLSPARVPQIVVKRAAGPRLPTTIPGRLLHDVFCLVLLGLDWTEWFVILFYRLLLDIRAGPGGTALVSPRRQHAKRFYV